MEQQLQLDLPKKCAVAAENLEEQIMTTEQAIAVLEEQAKYTGAGNLISSVEQLKVHTQEQLVPSYKETKEFYEATGAESAKVLSQLGMLG